MLLRGLLTLLVLTGLAVPSASDAFLIQGISGPQSATNGIALGPDGNFWVAEQFSGTVARIAPDGKVVDRFMVGSEPHAVVAGPGDRVWVAVNGANSLVWFDATSAQPTVHATAPPAGCDPDGLVPANGRMYFSCSGNATLGFIKDDGTGSVTTAAAGGGTVYDLEAVGGKLFAPDYSGNVVRRLSADLAVESTVGMPTAASAPDGITTDGAGTLWVTENATGKVARFPAAQAGGTATEFTPSGGSLSGPFGIVVGADHRVYVAAKDSHTIVRLDADGTDFAFYGVPDGGEPLNIINGPDGEIWATDQNKTRVLRLVNSAPRVVTGAASASGAVQATVDPRGNDTTVVFDYGPTAAYGSSTPPVTVASGAAPVPVSAALAGLAAGTTYHVRARATNAEGETPGADTTFTTAAAPTPTPTPTPASAAKRLKAKTSVKVKVGRRTVVRKIVISGLVGTETATIRCSGKGCPFKKKTYELKAGRRTFGKSLFKGRKLGKGVKVTVRVTAPGAIGTSTTLTVRRGKKPKVKRT